MIDPVIFSFDIAGVSVSLRWYGVLITIGVMVGAWISERGVQRRGGDPEHVWNALVWAIPSGVLGARAWYVANDILGGGTRYLDNPTDMIRITQGGLHIYGALLFGALSVYLYTRKNKVDLWLLLDSVGPGLLIGQGIARPANFINQELYGPPTDLPWGIAIDAHHRLSPWNDLTQYPIDSTRFHPTFAYEMIWNFFAGGLILWLARRYDNRLNPGTGFALWLVLAGLGRIIIETFRPDQPRLPGTGISYTRIASGLMAVVGTLMLVAQYGILRIPLLSTGRSTYVVAQQELDSTSPSPEDSD